MNLIAGKSFPSSQFVIMSMIFPYINRTKGRPPWNPNQLHQQQQRLLRKENLAYICPHRGKGNRFQQDTDAPLLCSSYSAYGSRSRTSSRGRHIKEGSSEEKTLDNLPTIITFPEMSGEKKNWISVRQGNFCEKGCGIGRTRLPECFKQLTPGSIGAATFLPINHLLLRHSLLILARVLAETSARETSTSSPLLFHDRNDLKSDVPATSSR